MNYLVTKTFIGGLLEGITITDVYDFKPEVGFVCEKPIGGSPYKIVSVEEMV